MGILQKAYKLLGQQQRVRAAPAAHLFRLDPAPLSILSIPGQASARMTLGGVPSALCKSGTIGDRTVGRHIDSMPSWEDGQSVTEYAVILALILVLVFGVAGLVGGKSNAIFSHVANDLQHRIDQD